MGKWCRDKKSSGCAMCKPHKHGYALKYKEPELSYRRRTDKEIREIKLVDASSSQPLARSGV